MKKNILVIGATGMLGKPVTHALLQSPDLKVTIMARYVATAKALFPGARVVEGDVFDPLSLLAAFEGQDAVYISLGPSRNSRPNDRMPEREGIDNIISVAQTTGIKRLALLSSLVQQYNGMNGFRWWIFDMKQEAVNKIRTCGIPYTIFYPSSFMENFDQLMMKGSNIMLAGESKALMYFIAGQDYGKQVARSFSILTNENKEYAVQGAEAYNWDNAAAIFIKHYTKKKLKPMKAPLGMLRFMGKFSTSARYTAKILEALNNYPEKFESHHTWQELGKPEITLAQYAAGL